MRRMLLAAISPILLAPVAFGQVAAKAQIQVAQPALKVFRPAAAPGVMANTSEVVIVGKVTDIEKEPSKAVPAPGATDKVEYTVAVIKISESIKGINGVTTVRVGFQPNAAAPFNGGGADRLRTTNIRPIGIPAVTLTEGQEGCFFLNKHHAADFYVLNLSGPSLDKNSPDFSKQVDTIKKVMKILAEPLKALKEKEASDRQLAASTLIESYRTYPAVNNPKTKVLQEPIDAEESKLIMTILAEMPWNSMTPESPSLANTFYRLGVQPKDGYTQPKFQQGVDFNKVMSESVVKWLKDNADKYRIQKFAAKTE